MKNARAKRAKLLFIAVKYANVLHSCRRRCSDFLSALLKDRKTEPMIYSSYLRGSYNLEKSLNFSSRLEKSLNLVESLQST